jgi:glucose uptake protein GlcU
MISRFFAYFAWTLVGLSLVGVLVYGPGDFVLTFIFGVPAILISRGRAFRARIENDVRRQREDKEWNIADAERIRIRTRREMGERD